MSIYSWIPEIKLFVHNLTKSPEKRGNLLSGGKSQSIYTIVEQVEEGYICLVRDSWFLLKENVVEKTQLIDNIKDENKLKTLRALETTMKYSTITNDRVNFRISENLTIGLSVNKKGLIYINENTMNKESTLESLFSSPLIPLINKNFYPVILETSKNLDKFVEMDVVKKITNIVNPYLEAYAFNYKSATYLYRCDERYGNSFFKYESALDLVNEVRTELNYDLTFFFENKINKDLITKRKLEDKEREISIKLEDVKFNISKINNSIKYIGETKILNTALENLTKRSTSLEKDLSVIKELQYKERTKA